jgi:glycosyltransferase involved in cell wall biosynthesis
MRAANNTAKIYLLAPGAAPDEPKSFWSAATYAVKDAIKLAIGRPRLKERPDITRDRSVAKLVEMIRGRDIDVPVRYCSGLDEDLASASRELDLDVVFLAMRSPLIRPVCAVIGYVPDYQHRYLPHLFSAREIAHRDQVSARLIADSDAMIMNARTVAEDMRNFSEGPLPSLHALPFSPTASTEWMEGRPDLLSSYAISGPYFIICNQFWVHKDHLTAFRAIAEVADHHQNVTLVCTGSLLDYRNPTYFEKLQAEVVKLGLVSRIRFLGHVPKRDQIELLKHAVAVVQPTLFEGGPGGGSTYEAVALGQRVLLSDLPVNQEIDSGDVRFFPCGDHVALAKLMNLALDETCIVRNPAALIARSNARLRRNGEAIWASIMAAIIAHKQKACGRTIGL